MSTYRNPAKFTVAERVLIFILGRLAEIAWILFCILGMIFALVYVLAREVVKRHRSVRALRPVEYRSLPSPSTSAADETVRLEVKS